MKVYELIQELARYRADDNVEICANVLSTEYRCEECGAFQASEAHIVITGLDTVTDGHDVRLMCEIEPTI